VRDHRLVVELFDPEKGFGDCCSSGFIRQNYQWDGISFAKVGNAEKGAPKQTSRRRLSVFGMQTEQMKN
jgi:hypothetical protein